MQNQMQQLASEILARHPGAIAAAVGYATWADYYVEVEQRPHSLTALMIVDEDDRGYRIISGRPSGLSDHACAESFEWGEPNISQYVDGRQALHRRIEAEYRTNIYQVAGQLP